MKDVSAPVIYPSVSLGKNCIVEDGVEIGRPGKTKLFGGKTIVGDNCRIRRGTIIYAGVRIGKNFVTGHYSLVREGNVIGENVSIGSFTELGRRNKIGDRTRIHSRCFLEDATVGKEVFIGPGVIITNDPHPPSPNIICFKGARIQDGAAIGGGATILPHITVGKRALVGAGSVVISDVPDRSVVVGNPAKKIKNIEDIVCRRRGKLHRPYEK